MASSLQYDLDTQVIVHTRDDKVYIGWMRSFDTYTNIVLEGAVERIVVRNEYADIPVGLIVLRGETISTLSSKPPEAELSKSLKKVPLESIITEYTEEREKQRRQEEALRKHLAEKNLVYESQFDESWVV